MTIIGKHIIAATVFAIAGYSSATMAQPSPTPPTAETPTTPPAETPPPPSSATPQTSPSPAPTRPPQQLPSQPSPSNEAQPQSQPPQPQPQPSQPQPQPSQPQPAQPSEQQPPEAGGQPQGAAECPAFLRGSKMKVTDTKGGVSVAITTNKPANVARLRDLVDEVAGNVEEQSNAQHAEQSKQGSATTPTLNVKTHNIEGGSQVIVRTDEADKVDLVRKQARKVETAWKSSTCGQSEASG